VRICLFTMHSPAIERLAVLTVPNKSDYCCRNGYDFWHAPFKSRNHWFPGYDRIPHLLEILDSDMFDWVFWLGCDALITNLDVKLESIIDPEFGMVVASDGNELQMDSFLINSKCIPLLTEVWKTRDLNWGPYFEQSNLIMHLCDPRFGGLVRHVPQRTMNSMDYSLYPDYAAHNSCFAKRQDVFGNDGQWQPGDFVFHVPGRPIEVKDMALKERIPLIFSLAS
jgi:hypothetical protein